MHELSFFFEMLLALALGALVGLERERRLKGELFAGIRTFMLISLFGFLVGYFSQILASFAPIYIGLATVSALTISSYIIRYYKTKSVGLTTEIAFIITYVIGILVFFESFPYLLPVSLTILLTLILLSKESLHKFAKHLSKKEIKSAVIFFLLAFVILPILPNYPIDPWNVLNPQLIWKVMIFILGISFISYIAMKIFGSKKGLALTGFFGGLFSSMAVTAVMVKKSKEKNIIYSAIFAIVIASSTMFLRQLIIASIFNFNLLPTLSSLLILAAIGFIYSYSIWKKTKKEHAVVKVTSPLTFDVAIKFTAIFVAVLLITNFIKAHFEAIYLFSFFAGLIEVDAITASLALSASPFAASGILLAGIANTVTKLLVCWFGNKKIRKETGKIFSIILLAGLVLFIWMVRFL